MPAQYLENIRRRRDAATPRITRIELAKASGIHVNTILKLEKHAQPNMSRKTSEALSEALERLEENRKENMADATFAPTTQSNGK